MEGRNPRDLQGLLRFAMELTKAEDAPHDTQFVQMDEERRRFLEEVINSMTVNVGKEFEEALQILSSERSTDNEKISAMERVQEFVDNIDDANNFVKLGGDRAILNCLISNNVNLRNLAATLIAEMCQNNPVCQNKFGSTKVFELLVSLLNDKEVAVNSMHAISCLTRHHEPSINAFAEIGGLECLLACIKCDTEKVAIKSCFLISALSSEFRNIKDKLVNMGAIEALAGCVQSVSEFDTKTESILAALNTLIEPNEIKCDFQKTALEAVLKSILENTKDKPECEEMRQFCHTLLNIVQDHHQSGMNAAER